MAEAMPDCLRCGKPCRNLYRTYCSKDCFYQRITTFAEQKALGGQDSVTLRRWRNAKVRAQKKEWTFDLTPEFVKELLASKCLYCGTSAQITIDRGDSSGGYVQANCVPACWRCNATKGFMLSVEQMKVVAKALGWTEDLYEGYKPQDNAEATKGNGHDARRKKQ